MLHGDADPMVPVENGRETAATIPGAELRIIQGMGHGIPLQLVPAFADAIMAAASRRPRECRRTEPASFGRTRPDETHAFLLLPCPEPSKGMAVDRSARTGGH